VAVTAATAVLLDPLLSRRRVLERRADDREGAGPRTARVCADDGTRAAVNGFEVDGAEAGAGADAGASVAPSGADGTSCRR
jgi:hypothetical protein